MRRILLILSLCSNVWFGVTAQQDSSYQEPDSIVYLGDMDAPEEGGIALQPVISGVTLGIGHGQSRDTYLTPLMYEGTTLTYHYDRMRLYQRSGIKGLNHLQTVDVDLMKGEIPSGLASAWSGRLRYRYAGQWMWSFGGRDHAPVQYFIGPCVGSDLGFNYNLKLANGNNPATVRFTTNAFVSTGVIAHYKIRQQPCDINLLVQAPLIGVTYMPDYGGSYYETFQLNTLDDVEHFTSLHNQQDLDFRLTTDIPMYVIRWLRGWDATVRLGFAYHIETMRINHITTRFSTCEFVFGWSYQYLPLSRRKVKQYNLKTDYAY